LKPKTTDDRYKLKQAILYIAERTQPADAFGAVKMNKVLYRAQCAALQEGRPLTAFHFQKNAMGPTLRAYMPITREMEQEGLISLEFRPMGSKKETRIRPLVAADMRSFSKREIEILNEEIERAWTLTAKQISDEEHETAAWYATFTGETIRPELSLVEDPGILIPLSDEERKRAHAAVERFRARAGVAPDHSSRTRVR
jgi:hypothetical protein